MNKVLLIVPTRSRSKASLDFYKSFIENSSITDLMFAIDEDDADNYPRIDGVLYEVNPRMGMNGTLNYVALKYLKDYDYIVFMGDDHRIRTKDWDVTLSSSIGNKGLAYGNDLFQKENLPTSVMISSNIISAIGYMAPPNQKHLYLDDFWLLLGKKLDAIYYHPDVIIEHMHYTLGKSEVDELYSEVNDPSMYSADQVAFSDYINNQFELDLEKIKKI